MLEDQTKIDLISSQIMSMSMFLVEALDYHYKNFLRAQKKINFDLKTGEKINAKAQINNILIVKFEVVAYLNQIGRFIFFLRNMKNNGLVSDISFSKSEIYMFFRNKYATHRSVDDPNGESEEFQFQVAVNLDIASLYNARGEYILSLVDDSKKGHGLIEINLTNEHKIIKQEVSRLMQKVQDGLYNKKNKPASSSSK